MASLRRPAEVFLLNGRPVHATHPRRQPGAPPKCTTQAATRPPGTWTCTSRLTSSRCPTLTGPSTSTSAWAGGSTTTTPPRWTVFASSSSRSPAPAPRSRSARDSHGRAGLGRGRPGRLRHRGGSRRTHRSWHRRQRDMARPAVPRRGTAAGPRPRAHQLRVVLHLHRFRRQYVAGPGGHHAAARPDRRRRHSIRVHSGPGQRAPACRSRPRRAPEAHRAAAPAPPAGPRRGLARLARRLHRGGPGRDGSADVTELSSPRTSGCGPAAVARQEWMKPAETRAPATSSTSGWQR